MVFKETADAMSPPVKPHGVWRTHTSCCGQSPGHLREDGCRGLGKAQRTV